jgi:ATP-dependent helicase/nuclease subunit B
MPSRWLLKLDALLEAAGLGYDAAYSDYIMDVVRGLDAPVRFERIGRPAPRPPAGARPKELWATAVEKLYRDPYIIYADKILGLRKLDPVDTDARPADFGGVVHRSLEEFHRLGLSGAGALMDLMLRAAAPFMRVDAMDFWVAKFRAMAEWFSAYDADARAAAAFSFAEREGSLSLPGGFTLRAKADRIDILRSRMGVVSDYKTGSAPTRREMDEGFAPQLPLEALILEAGGFADVPKAAVGELRYVELGKGRMVSYSGGLDRLLSMTMRKLRDTVEKFSHPGTPYLSRPNPNKVGSAIEEYSEYAHLARVGEWDG